MKRLRSVLAAVAAASSLGLSAPAEAGGAPAATSLVLATSTGSGAAAATFSMRHRFARETVRYGQSDQGVYKIAHVRELQYRLRWVGVFGAGATGYFGDLTRAAVSRYQRREHLNPSGVANHATWAHLLRDSLRHRPAILAVCRHAGWHACYDRSMHQVVLLRNGRYVNTWLVRGGASSSPTRLGTHRVYYRDIDHRSRLYGGSPMPYSQFFDGGQALHGSGYMIDPFYDHSHGCVNMYIEDARQLWNLTRDKRLIVTVYGHWD